MSGQAGTFCTVFPNYRDFHFFKDPGQIPYRFSKMGYNSSVICYGGDDDLSETRKYLEVVNIPDSYFSHAFNSGIVRYLIRNAGKIDILNVFHYSWRSLLFAFIYKTFNRKGFVYLKLDHCVFALMAPGTESVGDYQLDTGRTNLKGRIKDRIARHFFVSKVDLWSVEDEYSRALLEEKHDFLRARIITVYNGHTSDLPGSVSACDSAQKEDIILTAGRLGTLQKATEVLLDAFKSVAGSTQYDLHLAGPVEPAFQAYADRFLQENPALKGRVVFHGPMGRDNLYRLYGRSKIFCLPSRFEGMAIVFPEAMYNRNAIVTTNNVSIKPMIEKYAFGLTVERDDAPALAGAIKKLLDDRSLMDEMADRARKVSITLLNWDNIVKDLQQEIDKRLNSGSI